MTNITHGMDIAEVERLGAYLRDDAGAELEKVIALLDKRLKSTSWSGGNADAFKSKWKSSHAPNLRKIKSDLATFGQLAIDNAAKQRSASDTLEGSSGTGDYCPVDQPVGGGGGSSDDAFQNAIAPIEDLLNDLGFVGKAWDGIVKALRLFNPDALKMLGNLVAQNSDLIKIFQSLDTIGVGLDVAGFLVSFMQDTATMLSNGSPFDEALVHGLAYAGVILGADKGAEWLGKAIGTAIGGPVGGFVGWGGGVMIGKAYEFADGELGLSDGAADLVLDAYKDAKAVAGFVGEAAEELYEGVKDLGGAIKDGAEDLYEGAKDVGGWVGDKLDFWNG
ncbi:MAG: hypothetical protein V9E99_03820 [Microthrixaceae bacterium]